MPTTIDRFFAVVQLCQNLATMQNNMRTNVSALKTSHDAALTGSLTTVATPYVAGSGTLVVTDGTKVATQNLLGLNNAAKTVLRVTARNGNTFTVAAKQNDANAAAGLAVAAVSELFGDFPAMQTATRALGTAFLQRLDMNAAIVQQYPAQVQAGAEALGIVYQDMTDIYNLLRTWATNLSTATITNQTQLDNGVNAVLANVPESMLLF